MEAAANLSKSSEYVCSGCGTQVILRAGRFRIPHFAHRPYITCSFSEGETVAHLTAKRLWVDALRQRGVKSDIEYPIGEQRADVVAWDSRGRLLVIELQHTSLSVDELRSRIGGYRRRNIPQIWLPFIRREVFDYKTRTVETEYDGTRTLFIRDYRSIAVDCAWNPSKNAILPDRTSIQTTIERYSIRPFERYLSKIGDGNLWLYDETSQSLIRGTFMDHTIETDGGYDQDAGYHDPVSYTSRRWRELYLSPTLSLDYARLKYTNVACLGIDIIDGRTLNARTRA